MHIKTQTRSTATRFAAITFVALFALTAAPALAGPGNSKGKGKSAEQAGKHIDKAKQNDHTDRSAGNGGKGDEMRARRDERKAIMEEYRANRVPGQEGQDGKKAKKPWYKFWQRD